jgi:hypothetical protein
MPPGPGMPPQPGVGGYNPQPGAGGYNPQMAGGMGGPMSPTGRRSLDPDQVSIFINIFAEKNWRF